MYLILKKCMPFFSWQCKPLFLKCSLSTLYHLDVSFTNQLNPWYTFTSIYSYESLNVLLINVYFHRDQCCLADPHICSASGLPLRCYFIRETVENLSFTPTITHVTTFSLMFPDRIYITDLILLHILPGKKVKRKYKKKKKKKKNKSF